jgi:hypothetical protein
VDVLITTGKTPDHLEHPAKQGACYQTQPDRLLIWLPGVARFLVAQGREMLVEAEPHAAPAEIRRLLLSAPFAALLLQRGLLPFHASAVAIEGAGVLVLGGPCAGKSTLAGLLLDCGGRILSDDITAIRCAEDREPWVMPGYAELELWPDSLAALGGDLAAQTVPGNAFDKRVLRVPDGFASQPVALRAIYVLEPGNGTAVELRECGGVQRAAALLKHVHRLEFTAGAAREAAFLEITRLAKTTRVSEIRLPGDRLAGEELAHLVAADCRR